MIKNKLTPQEYHVLIEKGTEEPFTGELLYNKKKGTYHCKACNNKIFNSAKKYDSGTGWPSFNQAIKNSVKLKRDGLRIEVTCAKCNSHLGHLFIELTGKRYCINSIALKFKEERK